MAGRAARGPAIDERKFHSWLARHLPAGREGLLPLGDDAAALSPPRGRVAVVTTDALVEGTHFLRSSPPDRVGSAAAAVNLSDLAAKGAAPAAVLLAIVVPPGTPRSWATAVALAAERTAHRYGALLAGGDTKPGPVRAVVGFALGWGRPGRLAPRTGARVGDVLATTGTVGRGGLAAAHLRDRRRLSSRVLSDLLDVRPRVREGIALARWAHAMLDTSDGLAEATRLLATASRVRVVVDEARLPFAPGLRRGTGSAARRRTLAYYGGDYELLVALAPRDLARARRALGSGAARLTPIGRIETGRGAWLAQRDRFAPMPPAGWQPFARPPRGGA